MPTPREAFLVTLPDLVGKKKKKDSLRFPPADESFSISRIRSALEVAYG